MQLLFTYPHLTAPTAETVREYASKRFKKLSKYAPKFNSGEQIVKITVTRQKRTFVVHVEIRIPQALNIKVEDFDLRRAIDLAYQHIKQMLLKYQEKRHQRFNPVT